MCWPLCNLHRGLRNTFIICVRQPGFGRVSLNRLCLRGCASTFLSVPGQRCRGRWSRVVSSHHLHAHPVVLAAAAYRRAYALCELVLQAHSPCRFAPAMWGSGWRWCPSMRLRSTSAVVILSCPHGLRPQPGSLLQTLRSVQSVPQQATGNMCTANTSSWSNIVHASPGACPAARPPLQGIAWRGPTAVPALCAPRQCRSLHGSRRNFFMTCCRPPACPGRRCWCCAP